MEPSNADLAERYGERVAQVNKLRDEVARLTATIQGATDAQRVEDKRRDDEVANLKLQIREKDDWIKALETRVDTQTKMLAALGLTELRDHPDYVEKRKDETGHWCVRSQDTPCPQCGATQ